MYIKNTLIKEYNSLFIELTFISLKNYFTFFWNKREKKNTVGLRTNLEKNKGRILIVLECKKNKKI